MKKIRVRLTASQVKTIREIVTNQRGGELSPVMRTIADEIARDTLRDEYGIHIGLKKLARIAG